MDAAQDEYFNLHNLSKTVVNSQHNSWNSAFETSQKFNQRNIIIMQFLIVLSTEKCLQEPTNFIKFNDSLSGSKKLFSEIVWICMFFVLHSPLYNSWVYCWQCMHCLPSTCWPTVLSNLTILPNIITRKESSACEFHLYVCEFWLLLLFF